MAKKKTWAFAAGCFLAIALVATIAAVGVVTEAGTDEETRIERPNVSVWAEDGNFMDCRILASATVRDDETLVFESNLTEFAVDEGEPARLVRESGDEIIIGEVDETAAITVRAIDETEDRISQPLIYVIDEECTATIEHDPYAEGTDE